MWSKMKAPDHMSPTKSQTTHLKQEYVIANILYWIKLILSKDNSGARKLYEVRAWRTTAKEK